MLNGVRYQPGRVIGYWVNRFDRRVNLVFNLIFFYFSTGSTGSTGSTTKFFWKTKPGRVSRTGLTPVTQNPAGLTG